MAPDEAPPDIVSNVLRNFMCQMSNPSSWGKLLCCSSWSRTLALFLTVFLTSQTLLVSKAQANPLKALFSIFEKKEKPRRAPTVIVPRTRSLGGKRIFNPFLNGNGRGAQKPQAAKPKSFNTGRRTMCVRLCDGYYWPMKRGGSNNSLMTDSHRCESQCSSKAQLFILRSSTDNIAGMRSLSGKPYSRLENAFAYRKKFNPSCRCKAEPWSERARLRHKRYSAVGKERRALAIRAIRLDLRSSLLPGTDAVMAVSAKVPEGVRFWDPILPERKPAQDVALAQPLATTVRVGVIQTSGEHAETAHEAQDVAPKSSTSPFSAWDNQNTARQDRSTLPQPNVRIRNFGDLQPAPRSRVNRLPRSPIRRRVDAGVLRRSPVLSVSVQLRPRLN